MKEVRNVRIWDAENNTVFHFGMKNCDKDRDFEDYEERENHQYGLMLSVSHHLKSVTSSE